MIAYAVTDPSTLDFNTLQRDMERFSKKASMIVYRDKFGTKSDVKLKAVDFVEAAKGFAFKQVLIHGDHVLADSVKADGVHLTSQQLGDIAVAKAKDLFVVVSTHTLEELKKAELLGADMATFSPIYETANKGLPVGLEVLENMISQVTIPILALGGIVTEEQIAACERSGAAGFASIRYFAA
ncbi:MAG: thiamine phosphate synthase [Sulfurovum sp.]|nr:MAG: thiamine phosphate synthase [Sulfurovum sp.]